MKELSIKSAKHLSDYKIELIFSDDKTVVVDFFEFLNSSSHPDIRKYLKLELFTSFQLVEGDLDWGDLDLTFPIWDLYTNSIVKKLETDSGSRAS